MLFALFSVLLSNTARTERDNVKVHILTEMYATILIYEKGMFSYIYFYGLCVDKITTY